MEEIEMYRLLGNIE